MSTGTDTRTGPATGTARAISTGTQLDEDAIRSLLGDEAASLLEHKALVPAALLHAPGPDAIDAVFGVSDRSPRVLANLARIYGHGRLAGTGYLSILPVDQGVEHSGGASFAANPAYFDPENIVRLGVDGGCNAVASTLGVLGAVSRRWAHRIPFIAKLNHNELLTYPNRHEQLLYGTVEEAWNLGAAAVGATVYFGSPDAGRELTEVARAFAHAHELGMATVLWCYLRNPAFTVGEVNHETAADLTGQANHLGVTIEADLVKQKLATHNGGYVALRADGTSYGKVDKRMYSELASDHPVDLARYQVLNCFAGRIGMVNSGGASSGAGDLAKAVRTAVVNKRAGGTGVISGRKAFQRPTEDGIALLHAIQDVYLCPGITLA